MTYTIKQAAKKMGITVPTLRYYDREGLLPFIDKKPSGIRIFKEDDMERLDIITCMKNSGMPIKEIRKYMQLCEAGDSTLEERLQFFYERKEAAGLQIEVLNKVMETINHKIWYYETAIEAGTEAVHKRSQQA
ncbi:MAG: MerR family transcriptional regulator [Bacillota bacterium]|nr:MerR family transcriptional regulator [Oscillospiraceae bacterium]MDF3001156.1 MerR family transcriptional regulator [Bacillota bacterium]